jgi:hypothetical protein
MRCAICRERPRAAIYRAGPWELLPVCVECMADPAFANQRPLDDRQVLDLLVRDEARFAPDA